MKKQIAVISPKCSKESAERLASLLGAVYLPAEQYDYTDYHAVVNYGSSNVGEFRKVVNHPHSVKLCVNKISTLRRVSNGVQYTKDPAVALDWLKKDGAVVARATENGSRSEGVIICFTQEAFKKSPAKFWTRYFDHEHEVRINVFKDKILSVYEKVEVDEGIFTFFPLEIQGEENQEVQAMINSVRDNIGITIYGMDVLVNSSGKCKLLEVNSGPILMEGTEEALVRELKKELSL